MRFALVFALAVAGLAGCSEGGGGNSSDDLQEQLDAAYARGYQDGLDGGYSNGYAEGVDDTEDQYNSRSSSSPAPQNASMDCTHQQEEGDSYAPVRRGFGVAAGTVSAGEAITVWVDFFDCQDENTVTMIVKPLDAEYNPSFQARPECSTTCLSGNYSWPINIPDGAPKGWYHVSHVIVSDSIGNENQQHWRNGLPEVRFEVV